MTFYRVGYDRFNVTLKICNKDILIATISPPLIGLDTVYINMYFPYEECSEVKISTNILTESEMLEKAKNIIVKKLYRIHSDILDDLKTIAFDENKYKGIYTVRGNFACGRVYAVK